MGKRVIFVGSIYGMIEMGFQILVFTIVLNSLFCVLEIPEFGRLIYLFNILYLNRAECRTEFRVGLVEASLPNGATVTISETPFTADRTFVFAVIYLVLGVFGFFSSFLMLLKAKLDPIGIPSELIRAPFTLFMTLISFTDIISTIIYMMDIFNTINISSLANYIGANAVGFQGINIDYAWTASMLSTFYFSRCFVFWFIRNSIVYSVLTTERKITIVPDSERQTAEASTETTEQRAIGTSYSPPQSLRIWNTLRNYPLYKSNRQKSKERIPKDNKNNKIQFPLSLLSLPQRLERIMTERDKKILGPVELADQDSDVIDETLHTPRPSRSNINITAQQKKSLNQTYTEHSKYVEAATKNHVPNINSGGGTVLRGTIPWSYTPELAGYHRMRDQLPPDEELPPVPVPDYTVNRRRPSLIHLSPILRDTAATNAKRNSIRGNSLTSNDVLY